MYENDSFGGDSITISQSVSDLSTLDFDERVSSLKVQRKDSDSDGMDDAWETTHFSGLSQLATSDPDHDGLTNLYEYFSGTSPVSGQNASAILGPQTALVPLGSDWRYLDNGSDQGVAWRSPTFDHAAWSAGKGPLGYGDPTVVTQVQFGTDAANKHVTTYFRREFEAPSRTSWNTPSAPAPPPTTPLPP